MQLIRGTYSKEDALEIIRQIIEAKVKFHEEKISISDNEEDIKMREKRIKDLNNDFTTFRKSINAYSGVINMNALLNLNRSETTSRSFKLIDGTFNLEDARQILITAYNSKINFHKLQVWCKSERGEVGIDQHTARILELQIESDAIRKLLNAQHQEGTKVSINCSIKIEFESERINHVSESRIVHSH